MKKITTPYRWLLILALWGISTTLFAQKLWTGATNTDWNTASNWSNGVPAATDIATIKATATNNPTITTNVTIKRISVELGKIVTVASGATLTISTTENDSPIINSGTINNNGRIAISAVQTGFAICVDNAGAINNNAGSEFSVDGTAHLLTNFTTGVITNAGKMIFGATKVSSGEAIQNSGIFNNDTGGNITIDNCNRDGINNLSSGTFNNSGKIAIGLNSKDPNGWGVYNSNIFNNKVGAELSINNIKNHGLYNSSKFNNDGKITIGVNGTIGIGIGASSTTSASSTFTNTSTGEITIDRTIGDGINNQNSIFFINAGKIAIGSNGTIGSAGIRGGSRATFSNTGDITIDRTAYSGIDNQNIFTNTGKITIGANAKIGEFGVYTSGTTAQFNNSGDIKIDRSNGGIITTNQSIFTNTSKITIGAIATVGSYGVWALGGTFNNNTCTALVTITSNSAFITSNSTTTNSVSNNSGVITVTSAGNNVTTNTGIIQNIGGGSFTVGSGNAAVSTATSVTDTPPTAQVTIQNGGNTGLEYSKDNTLWQASNVFPALTAGVYTFKARLQKDNACVVTAAPVTVKTTAVTPPPASACAEATASIGNPTEKGVYTVNVPTAGAYTIRVTYTSWEDPAGATATIAINSAAGGTINLPATTSPAVYKDVTINKVLVAGNNTITLGNVSGFYRVTKVCAETVAATTTITNDKVSDIGNPSERATYTLFIPKAGQYDVYLKYTSWENPAGITLNMSFDGGGVGALKLPATPNMSTYENVRIARINYTVGEHTVMVFPFSGFMRVAAVSAVAVPSAARLGSFSEPDQSEGIAIEAYPNPATDVVHLSYNLPHDSPVEIGLYDLMGQLHTKTNQIGHRGNNQIDVPVNNLLAGVYFFKLNYGQQSKTTKVLINK
jgi:Secretion system C-terminal sorting domain/Carbohydrate binding module (family 35)